MLYRYSNGIPPADEAGHGRGSLKWASGDSAMRVRWDSVHGNGGCKPTVGGGHLALAVVAAVSHPGSRVCSLPG